MLALFRVVMNNVKKVQKIKIFVNLIEKNH